MRFKFRICWIAVVGCLGLAGAASGATLKADYRFEGTLASSVPGAPPLANIGPGANSFQTDNVFGSSQQVLTFPQGNGVTLTSTNSIIPNDSYSIVVLFRFDKIDGYNRLVDFANGTIDNGLYDQSGQLVLFPDTSSSSSPITPNTYFQVVITRDAGGTVVGYVNGKQVLGPYDDSTSKDALITADNTLRFFIDDMAVPNEDSAGAVARIRLYDGPLTPAEVAALGPAPPPPMLGKAVDAATVSGTVLIKQGSRFVPLTGAQQIPVGSELNTRAGTVAITAASGTGHATYSGRFNGAVFKVAQSASGKQRGLSTLSLLDGAVPGAPTFASCKHASQRVLQTLHASDRGHFRSRGGYAAATVRGTIWDTTDRCDGTKIAVERGSVVVTDFRRHKQITLTAGHSYLAKAR